MDSKINIRNGSRFFSCELSEVTVTTDAQYVVVSVISKAAGDEIYSQPLNAHQGLVVISGIDKIIEADLRKNNLACNAYMIRTDDGAWVLVDVCYCECRISPPGLDSFAANNFLTTLSDRRIPPGAGISLYWYARSPEPSGTASLSFVAISSDGTLVRADSTLDDALSVDLGVQSFKISNDDLLLTAADALPNYSRLLWVTVNVSDKSATFYFDQSLDCRSYFSFNNCFNIPEKFYLPSESVTKQEVSQSVALCGGVASIYDRQVSISHEVSLSPQSAEEMNLCRQLLTSDSVSVPIWYDADDDIPLSHLPVLITDSDFELSDDSTQPHEVKFTWRFAESRPILQLHAPSGIFTHEFDNSYF